MGFINSLKAAVNGVLEVLRGERNAKIHLAVAFLVLLLGVMLGISSAEWAAVFFAILLVFLAEIVNTAIEKTLDLIDTKQNPRIRLIKDMTAGAVLVAAFGAAIVGVAVFWPYLLGLIWPGR